MPIFSRKQNKRILQQLVLSRSGNGEYHLPQITMNYKQRKRRGKGLGKDGQLSLTYHLA